MLRLIAVVAALSLGSILLGLGLSTKLDPARSMDDAALIEGAGEGQDAVDSDLADQPQSADEPDGGEEDQVSNHQSEEEGDGEGGLTVTRSNPPSPDLPQ